MAVWPPPAVVAALADVPVGTGRPTAADRLHVTLRFLGGVAGGGPEALIGALGPAVVAVEAPTAQLGPATATFGRHVLHVPVAGLDDLAAAVAAAVAAVGVRVAADDRPFVGHLTIARSRGRSGAADLRPAAGDAIPEAARAPWEVGEVTLVASAGGRYEVLARFPTR